MEIDIYTKNSKILLETCTICSLIIIVSIFTYLNFETSYISVLALFGVAAIRILPSLSKFLIFSTNNLEYPLWN